MIYKTAGPEAWTYKYPASNDPDGDSYDVKAETTVSFIGSTSEALTIPDLSKAEVKEGSHKVSVTLSDIFGASTSYEITLNIKAALVFDEETTTAEASNDENEVEEDAAGEADEEVVEEGNEEVDEAVEEDDELVTNEAV